MYPISKTEFFTVVNSHSAKPEVDTEHSTAEKTIINYVLDSGYEIGYIESELDGNESYFLWTIS